MERMPKIVDHDARRADIVQATWRLIARQGIRGTTMREIAREAGFANGALTPYFENKDAIVTAAFRHVFAATDERIAAATHGKRGFDALWHVVLEILPLDEERRLEARIVIPFWEEAVGDEQQREISAAASNTWRTNLRRHLEEAREAGDLGPGHDPATAADALFVFTMGTQALALLEPGHYTPERLRELTRAWLDALRAPA